MDDRHGRLEVADPDIVETLKSMNWDERLQEARARRESALKRKSAAGRAPVVRIIDAAAVARRKADDAGATGRAAQDPDAPPVTATAEPPPEDARPETPPSPVAGPVARRAALGFGLGLGLGLGLVVGAVLVNGLPDLGRTGGPIAAVPLRPAAAPPPAAVPPDLHALSPAAPALASGAPAAALPAAAAPPVRVAAMPVPVRPDAEARFTLAERWTLPGAGRGPTAPFAGQAPAGDPSPPAAATLPVRTAAAPMPARPGAETVPAAPGGVGAPATGTAPAAPAPRGRAAPPLLPEGTVAPARTAAVRTPPPQPPEARPAITGRSIPVRPAPAVAAVPLAATERTDYGSGLVRPANVARPLLPALTVFATPQVAAARLPDLATAPPPDTRVPGADALFVRIAVPQIAPETEVDRISAALAAAGVGDSRLDRVSYRVSESHLRYFHAADAETAAALARTMDLDLRDFTRFRPAPADGTIEIFLAGDRAAPVRSALRQPARPPRAAPPPDPATLMRDRIVEQLRRGGRLP